MYGTNTAPVQCFLATPTEVRNVPVEAKSLDESSLQLCKGEGAYTVIPIYPGAKVANRYSLHFNRLIESSNILQIPTKSFSQPDSIWLVSFSWLLTKNFFFTFCFSLKG